jgi:hypothetical protein
VNNRATGRLPTEFAELSRLSDLRLGWNGFSGSIPTELARLSDSLKHIILSSNQFDGTIPVSIFQELTSIVSIHLSKNLLTGPIPSEIQHFSGESLRLASNLLTGTIPALLFNASNLKSFKLAYNLVSTAAVSASTIRRHEV